MTHAKLHILRHSIGRDDAGHLAHGVKEEYRNFYATAPDCSCYKDIQELVASGLMKLTGKTKFSDMEYYHVTEDGRKVALDGVQHLVLTRSQQRYRRFLHADCGMSFIEWLQMDDQRRKAH